MLSQVLTGTGGVGKTQLAADYARAAWEDGSVDVLVWISASSRQTIMDGYAQAGVEVLAADPSDPEHAARAFLAWLEPKDGPRQCRWLVVLDDLADPADLRGLWPPNRHGRTLVTTRRREAALSGDGRRLLHVGMFMPWEAVAYLTAVLAAHGRHDPLNEIQALAADLGHLPLALAQAAAYLIDTAITCADYRRLLADRIRKLADLLPEPSALPDDQTTTVAATWSLSIERAEKLQPAGLARPMLQLTAMLDPNGIPDAVLLSEPTRAHLAAHRAAGHQGSALVTAEEAAGALRVLHRLSLIDHAPDTPHHAVRVHQLIQRVTRDTFASHQQDHLARTAADALFDVWPNTECDAALSQALRANTGALVRHAEDALFQEGAGLAVLFRFGSSLGHSGQPAAAIKHYEHMATMAHDRLGADDIYTLGARQELARWRGEAGDAAGAAAAFEHLLADELRVLGPDHTTTLSARAMLAEWRGEAGDAAGAAAAFEQLLADELRILGRDHRPFMTRANLATYRGRAGDPAGAAAAFEQLLADQLRATGPHDPITFTTRSDLGNWRGRAGGVCGAVTTHEQLLADEVRLLGPDHPWTLTTRHDLAFWRGEAGDAAGAAAAFEQLLADQERVLDQDHPKILTTRNNLAVQKRRAGDAAGAAAALEQLLAAALRLLGPDHPDTLKARANLASCRADAGDAAVTAAAYAELLDHTLRVLGPDHPDTLNVRNSLAYWRGKAGDAAGAVAAFEQLLADHLRVTGPDHPDALTIRANLATYRGDAGDAAGAAAAYAELLDHTLRVLGPDHPQTFTIRASSGRWLAAAGDGVGAAAVFVQLMADTRRVLGPDHPDTLAVRAAITALRREGEDTNNPAAYEPDLALTLSGLTAQLWKAERRKEAITAEQEAVEIRRRLAADNPAVYEPDLASSLAVLAMLLAIRGDLSEALRATGEAVELHRRHIATMPSALPQLYNVLGLQADLLEGLGRDEEAEAVRRWLGENPLPPDSQSSARSPSSSMP
ncbi:tetratricopeptide repeat protein [Streptomyces sp. Ag109_O5-1]|uniref:tetratricopeptide repeat protein n=1 Tax=Streptomyces sp. Ag109_O5-1 TaxID=1938851 RepID=UPI0021A3643C|nr:tetratricopeptide repeat protein [Streptomyces sp. Ag109_O5-1]